MVKTQFSRRVDEGASKFFRDGVSDCMDGTEGGRSNFLYETASRNTLT